MQGALRPGSVVDLHHAHARVFEYNLIVRGIDFQRVLGKCRSAPDYEKRNYP